MLDNLLDLFMTLLSSTTDNEIGVMFWAILIIIMVFSLFWRIIKV